MIRSLLGFLAALAVAAPAPAQVPGKAAVTDPAALFPADTLAYADVRKPGDLADVLAGWVKKTAFADPLERTHKELEKVANSSPQAIIVQRALGLATLVVSPESFAEIRRFHGIGVGVTGFTKDHQPEVAAAVLLGDSNIAGLAVRAFLTSKPDTRQVSTVEGVAIYQHRANLGPIYNSNNGQPFQPDDEANPLRGHQPMPGAGEATYAYTRGLLVVGTSATAVGDVIRRFQGKEKSASLAESEPFQKASADRGKGVFLYAVPPAISARLDQAKKDGTSALSPDFAAILRFVVNAKAVPVVTGNLLLKPDSVTLQLSATVDPNQPSPLANLLTGPAVSLDGFRCAGKDTALVMTLALPPEPERARAILQFLDSLAKANGSLGQSPSEAVTADDRKLLVGAKSVTVLVPEKQELPRGGLPMPMLVIHCESEEMAGKWVDSLPRFAKLLAGSETLPTPSSESLGSVKIVSTAVDGLPWQAPVHAARAGSTVILGLDRKLVAAAAGMPAAIKVPEGDRGVGVGVIRPTGFPDTFTDLGVKFLALTLSQDEQTIRNLGGNPFRFRRGFLAPPPPEPQEVDPKKVKPTPASQIHKVMDSLPPLTVRLSRDRSAIRLEIRQQGLESGLAPVVSAVTEWLHRSLLNRLTGNPGENGILPTQPDEAIEKD